MSGDSRFIFCRPRAFVRVLKLRRTNLCGAGLVGRSLLEADLGGAKWDKPDLHRANLRAFDILEKAWFKLIGRAGFGPVTSGCLRRPGSRSRGLPCRDGVAQLGFTKADLPITAVADNRILSQDWRPEKMSAGR